MNSILNNDQQVVLMTKKRQSTLLPKLDEVRKKRTKENKDQRSNKKESKYDPRNILNDLTGKEWIQETTSIWYQKGLGKHHPETNYERMHPAPFSFTNVKRLILFFTKDGQTVLDPFSGGGIIPLEALRLGCDTYANDYNPVAVIIQKCTIEFPQKFNKKDEKYGDLKYEIESKFIQDIKKYLEQKGVCVRW